MMLRFTKASSVYIKKLISHNKEIEINASALSSNVIIISQYVKKYILTYLCFYVCPITLQ